MSDDIIFRKSVFGGFNRDDVIDYIEKIKTENASVKKLLSDKESEVNQLKKEKEKLESTLNEEKQKANESYIEYEDKIAALKEEYLNKIEDIKAENANNESNMSAEERVGSAMLDVRRYADLLLQETCDKINKMSDDADDAVSKTLERALDISSGIQTFSDKLNDILKDILDENDKICKELSSFKGTLKLPFEEVSGELDGKVLKQ